MKTIQLATILMLAGVPGSALADAVTSRADLGADDNIQWGQFGPPASAFDTPAEGFSDGGVSFTVDEVGGNHRLVRFDQGDGWNGNFSPGDELIVGSFTSVIVIDFSRPIFGVGASVQGSFFGPFDGAIEVFDAEGDLIESFTRVGDSNDNADGSAIFIGIRSDTPIARAIFAAETEPAINMVGLVTIPAPSGLALLCVAGLVVTRRHR